MTNLEDRLKLEAQIQAKEARSHRATVREIYQAVTGRTGEPGDWNGAKPVLALIEERDALRKMASEFGAALISARARVADLESRLSSLDCRYAGAGVAEVSGSHCPADNPCDRCAAERRVAELGQSVRTMHADASALTVERDRYRAALDTVREEIAGCLKRDTDAFAQMTLDQVEHWNVSRHMQSHGYCLDQIDAAISPKP